MILNIYFSEVQVGDVGCTTLYGITDSCKDNNAECRAVGNRCVCKTGYFDNNGDSANGNCIPSKSYIALKGHSF